MSLKSWLTHQTILRNINQSVNSEKRPKSLSYISTIWNIYFNFLQKINQIILSICFAPNLNESEDTLFRHRKPQINRVEVLALIFSFHHRLTTQQSN